MNNEESKCGDDCKLVEMLATKTSKQQAMENAIAAVLTGNISQRSAAKRFGVSRETLRDRLKQNGNVGETAHDTSPPATPPAKQKAADKAERDQWWADHQAGLSARKISEKYGRSRLSITKEIKRREEAASQSEPMQTPAPTPTPSVPSAGSSTARPECWADHPLIEGWTGKLSEVGTAIYKRESVSSRKRVKIANQLAEFKADLERTMRAASNDHKKGGGKILEADVIMVEATLQKEKHPGITETLESVMNEAERIHRFASRALEIFQMKEVSVERLS